DFVALGRGGLGREKTVGAAFDGARRQWAIPNISVPNGIAMVLKFERASFGKRAGPAAPHVARLAFDSSVVLDQHSVFKDGDVPRVNFHAAFVNGPAEDNVIRLEFARWMQGVGHGWTGSVERGGKTVGISGVVVIVQNLDFGQAHQERAAVAAAL